MTWTAPDVERHEVPHTADEVASLANWLLFYRETLLWKCAGLTAEQLRLASCPPSPMSLQGLVRHMADVERVWFRKRIAGETVPYIYWTDADPDGDFNGLDGSDPAADFETFEREWRFAEAVVDGRDLDEVIAYVDKSGRPQQRDIRWILTHMVEEYARHLGHADLLRERIDGATGY